MQIERVFHTLGNINEKGSYYYNLATFFLITKIKKKNPSSRQARKQFTLWKFAWNSMGECTEER